ncbi:MAG: mechanosensitive ion channel family protein [Terriglobales bacterium]
MDFRNIAEHAWQWLIYIATASPYTIPFWASLAWLVVLVNWRATLRLIWRSLHLIEDLVLQRELFTKLDLPVKLLLLTAATFPFLHFIPGALGVALEKLAAFAIPLLSLYCFVQCIDLFLFTFYLGQRREANVPGVLRFVVLFGIYVVFGLGFLEWTLGVNVVPLLATSTVVTAVFGLALQDTLKNLFAGLTMSFEKRFRQGDWVMFRLDANNTTTGEVTEIGWRSTRIRTVDNNYAVIPNSLFTSNQLINYSQPTPAFPKSIEVPVRAGTSLEQVTEIVSAITNDTAGVLAAPPPEVLISAVRTDHLVYRIRFWVSEYAQADTVASQVIERSYEKLSAMDAVPATGAFPADLLK